MRLFYFLLILFGSTVISAQSWDFKKEVDGIKAYHKSVSDSKFKRYRIETELQGTVESMVAILQDIDSYPDIFPNQKKATLRTNTSDSLLEVFIHTKTPFPAKDRFSYTSSNYQFDKKSSTASIEINCLQNTYAIENNKGILITNCNGFWSIQDIGDRTLKVVHEFFADPEGKVPAWIINKYTVNAPIKAVKAIRKLLQDEKYQNRTFNFMN